MKLSSLGYLIKDNKVLMLYRNKKLNDVHKGKYNGVGGKFKKGESPEDCLRREVKEEVGVDIVDYRLRGIITFPSFKDEEDWIVFVYLINKWKGEINYNSPEGELKWFNIDDIFNLSLWDGDRLFLKWLFYDKKFFSAKIIYDITKENDYILRGYEVEFF